MTVASAVAPSSASEPVGTLGIELSESIISKETEVSNCCIVAASEVGVDDDGFFGKPSVASAVAPSNFMPEVDAGLTCPELVVTLAIELSE